MATHLIMLDDVDPAGTVQVVSYEGSYYVGQLHRDKPDGTLGEIRLALLSGPWPVFSEAYMRALDLHQANQQQRIRRAIEARAARPTVRATAKKGAAKKTTAKKATARKGQ